MRRISSKAASKLQQGIREARSDLVKGSRRAVRFGGSVLQSAVFLLIVSVSLVLAPLLFLVSRLWLIIGRLLFFGIEQLLSLRRPLTSDESRALAFGAGVTVVALAGYWLTLLVWPWPWGASSGASPATPDPVAVLQTHLALGQLYAGFAAFFLAATIGYLAIKEFARNQPRARLGTYLQAESFFPPNASILVRDDVASSDGWLAPFDLAIRNYGDTVAVWYAVEVELPFLNWKDENGKLIWSPETQETTKIAKVEPLVGIEGQHWRLVADDFHFGWRYRFTSAGSIAVYPKLDSFSLLRVTLHSNVMSMESKLRLGVMADDSRAYTDRQFAVPRSVMVRDGDWAYDSAVPVIHHLGPKRFDSALQHHGDIAQERTFECTALIFTDHQKMQRETMNLTLSRLKLAEGGPPALECDPRSLMGMAHALDLSHRFGAYQFWMGTLSLRLLERLAPAWVDRALAALDRRLDGRSYSRKGGADDLDSAHERAQSQR